ncbi:TenA family protein [Halalkalicoccus jeotgali]|uniref:Transcription regulator n=1 Tax=Halalkalicoccus jeotgali (strain DSM 18796 / CECT 7217 / JCM 14584 / KCTC 4019 / B3) TaxID=795797 RepID=D8J539_HALJB|nr:TenA family protein [Halalkalicoccus jeotgali]ADJ13620.1 transcription regulator [Halalkalicoccus jeotgali B3]ELY33358.1 transcriptional regulator [Halalkalicoccus jeotgali B3]
MNDAFDGQGRFSEWLRERSEPAWTEATRHRFVEELGSDALEDAVFERYLVQDYAFLELGARTTALAVAQAPSMDEMARLSQQLSVLTGSENDYFERAFAELGVSNEEWREPDPEPITRTFTDFMLRAAHEGGYEETLATTLAAEWVYLEWARHVADRGPERWYLEEWIEIHIVEGFEAYVAWLRGQLDAHGPALSARRQRRVAELFARTVDLEVAFFDMAYES